MIHKRDKILLIYILVQPLIDIATSLSTRFGISILSFGTVIRFLFLVIGFVLVLWRLLGERKLFLLVIFLLPFIEVLLMLLINGIEKRPFHVTAEISFAAKTVYYVVCLFVFYFYLHSKTLIKILTITASLYGLSMLAAIATHTGFNSYDFGEKGTTGWFFAANEIGATLGILLPFTLLYAGKKGWAWLAVILTLFGLYFIGTKVSFLSALVLLLLASGYLLVKRQKPWIVTTIVTLCFIGLIPLAPIYQNIKTPTYYAPPFSLQDDANASHSKNGSHHHLEDHPILRKIFSSRLFYFETKLDDYSEVSPLRKLFGMGYAGNYTDKKAKLVEMDFIDLWIAYGWIGVFFILLPLIVWLIAIVKGFIKSHRLKYYQWMLSFTCLLGLGIAFISGHVMFAPAVSIYFCLAIHCLRQSLLVDENNVL